MFQVSIHLWLGLPYGDMGSNAELSVDGIMRRGVGEMENDMFSV